MECSHNNVNYISLNFTCLADHDEYPGFLQDMKLVIYGTEHKPGENPDGEKSFNCHDQCLLTCTGPEPSQCDECKGKYYIEDTGEKVSVSEEMCLCLYYINIIIGLSKVVFNYVWYSMLKLPIFISFFNQSFTVIYYSIFILCLLSSFVRYALKIVH